MKSKKVKMKKIHCIFYGKYRKCKNSKISFIFKKSLVLSLTWSNCDSKEEKIFKEDQSIETLSILCLINDMEQEFRLKEVDKTINYFFEWINR